MEANFMRDYDCCGKIHASLHDLLKHCDEAHNSTSPNGHGIPMTSQRRPVMPQNPDIPRSSLPPAPPSTPQPTQRTVVRPAAIPNPDVKPKALLSPIPDLDDEVPDMEMDEENDPSSRNLSRAAVVPINTTLPPAPFRSSAPTTPAASQAFQLFGNPTVSSVNTPTLSTQSASQVDTMTTNPADGGFQQFLFPADGQMVLPMNYDLQSPGLQQDLSGLTIHDPANRLATASNPLQQLQLTINNSALTADPELNSPGPLSAGLPPSALAFGGQEEKKYRCPVIGCEKAYKNQNGLKYHKAHGHRNQKLIQNEDGTFSIVDPVTSVPYPGTVGMEKEKPYRCEVCGKRYKNLNGLKYHRQHNKPCGPELQLAGGQPAMPITSELVGLHHIQAG
jgi:transcription factor SFP1